MIVDYVCLPLCLFSTKKPSILQCFEFPNQHTSPSLLPSLSLQHTLSHTFCLFWFCFGCCLVVVCFVFFVFVCLFNQLKTRSHGVSTVERVTTLQRF